MHLQTQVHILELCFCCESLDSLIVFRDRNWRRPADILEQLEELGIRGYFMDASSYDQHINARIRRKKNRLGFLS
jgi:hypothetical protein